MHLKKIVCRDYSCYVRSGEFKKIVWKKKFASAQSIVKKISCLLEITIPPRKNNGPSLSSYCLLYQSIPSLIIPPGDPRVFARYHCPGDRVFAQLSLPGDRGFELENFPTVLKDKCRNVMISLGGSLKNRCSCAVSYQFLQRKQ